MNHRVLLARAFFVAVGCALSYWGWWSWSYLLDKSPPDVPPTVMFMAGLGAFASAGAAIILSVELWGTATSPLCKRDDDPRSF